MESDRIDRQLMYALRIDGRASFAQLGAVLGVSAQTVARRYRRLREAGIVRVVAMPGARAPGQTWLIRLRTQPDAAQRLADAIARRRDASWVTIVGGGTEILFFSRPASPEETDARLLERLGANALVSEVRAHMVLATFDDPGAREWSPGDGLNRAQRRALVNAAEGADGGRLSPSAPGDRELLRALGEDARATYAELGAAAGISAPRARRRVAALRAADVLRIECEITVAAVGVPTRAWIWMRVAPADLEAVARAVSALGETAYVAAVTGSVNLVAVAVVSNAAVLYRYLTERLGAIPAIRDVEISPVLAQVKQEDSIPRAGRLPRPGESGRPLGA